VSDVTIPSYRVPRDRGLWSSWRMLAVAGGLLGAGAAAGAVVWGLDGTGAGGLGAPRPVPVVEPDARPIKVRPEKPGGLVVPNTDQLVLEPPAVRKAAERQRGAQARLAPSPEAPQLDLLRRETAPPQPPETAAPAPATAAVPPPVAAGAPSAATPPQAEPRAATALGDPSATAALPPPRAAADPAPATPAPPAVLFAPGGRAQVQLGALASEEAARAEWTRLQRRVPELAGQRPQISRFDRGPEQPPLYRLRAGGLTDGAAARALCEAVRAGGGACAPVPGPGGG
jgi:sporulation related protein